MVNYRYEIRDIEKNHEAYENDGTVAASHQVLALLKPDRSKGGCGQAAGDPGAAHRQTNG